VGGKNRARRRGSGHDGGVSIRISYGFDLRTRFDLSIRSEELMV